MMGARSEGSNFLQVGMRVLHIDLELGLELAAEILSPEGPQSIDWHFDNLGPRSVLIKDLGLSNMHLLVMGVYLIEYAFLLKQRQLEVFPALPHEGVHASIFEHAI